MGNPEVPLGDRAVELHVPPVFDVETVAPPRVAIVPLEEAVRRALAKPLSSPPLRVVARARRNVVICVPDATRPLPPADALVPIVEEIVAAGVPAGRIGVLLALGLHRPPPREELEEHVGLARLHGVKVAMHDPGGAMADLGVGPHGVPLKVNRVLKEADLVLTFGWVEPHQYAGFSGGVKTAVIGCGSEETIAATHSPRFLDHYLCRPGLVTGNPFQDVLREAGRRLRIPFAVNAVPRGGMAAAAAAGDPSAVHLALSGKAREVYAVFKDQPGDAAVAGVRPPKDRDLYQASRGVTNLISGPSPAVRRGGVLILPAKLAAGVGEGIGGERFAALLRRPLEEIIEEKRAAGLAGGEQRAYVLAKVLSHRELIVVGAERPEALEGLPLVAVPDFETAFRRAAETTGGGRLLVFPDAIGTYLG